MSIPKVNQCNSLHQFLAEIDFLCQSYDITGIAVALSVQSGECISTCQYGMDSPELEIASALLADYAKGMIVDHKLN